MEIEEGVVDYGDTGNLENFEDDIDESSESEDPDRDRRKERNFSDHSADKFDDPNGTEANASGVGTSPKKSVTKRSTSSNHSKSDIQLESGEELDEEAEEINKTPGSNRVSRRQQYIREPVVIPELCKDGETVTAEMMITFLDTLKRAIANDQEIKEDLSTLIPATTYYTLN